MTAVDPEPLLRPSDLADEAIATVRRWLKESSTVAPERGAERLAGVLKDPRGLDFTLGFVDRVVRPEDLRVAARNFERLTHSIPAFLPWYLRFAILLGGGFAPLVPWPIVPMARWVLRRMVGHLVIDATPEKLDKSLATARQRIRLNLNLLGEAVLGDDEAQRRLQGTRDLLARDDVDYVSIKVSSVASQLSMWALDDMVELVVARLTPLYELAAASHTEVHQPRHGGVPRSRPDHRGLHALLDQPQLAKLEAGIVLQAYLPDALGALQGLTTWATHVARGVARASRCASSRAPTSPWSTWMRRCTAGRSRPIAQGRDRHQLQARARLGVHPEHTDAVRIGVAGHNLFDVAYAWLLAKQRRVENRVEFEMLLGMATGQADAVKRDVGGLLLYTPVVHPGEFDSAISYLIRRLEENASSDNFMSAVFELADDEQVFAREANRFLASLSGLNEELPTSNRVQSRLHAAGLPSDPGVRERTRHRPVDR